MPPKKGKKFGVKLSNKFPKASYKKQKTPPPEEEPQVEEEDESDTEDSPIFDRKVGAGQKRSKTASAGSSKSSAKPTAEAEPAAEPSAEPEAQPAAQQQSSSGGGKGKGKAKGKSKLTTESVSRTDSQESIECDEDDLNSDADEDDHQECKKRNTPLPVTLTTEQELAMVTWMEANPMLYDKSITEYRYTHKKTEMWEAQPEKLKLSVKQIKKWYNSQRTRYGRLGNTKSGQAAPKHTDRERWLTQAFSFLGSHIYRQPTRQSCSVSQIYIIYFVCDSKFGNLPKIV